MVTFISFCWKACFVVGKCENMNLGQKKWSVVAGSLLHPGIGGHFILKSFFFQKGTDQGSVEMWGPPSHLWKTIHLFHTGVCWSFGRFPPGETNHNMFLQNGSVSSCRFRVANVISGQIIIFHQPRFPWNFRKSSLTFHNHLGAQNSCFRSR